MSRWGLLVLAVALLATACTVNEGEAPATPRAEATNMLPTQTVVPLATASPSVEVGLEVESRGNADVTFVRAVQAEEGTWTFHVTVQHPDRGREDYADGWDVVLPDGTTLLVNPDVPFTRLLLHPHVDEQPFTRSQGGLTIPSGVNRVTVRAHDLVDGFGGRTVTVHLDEAEGVGFEVQR